jgi:hypothetical protein
MWALEHILTVGFQKFVQIQDEISIKIRGSFYGLNFDRNSLKIVRTSEFDEIWLAWSLVHLIYRKNEFPSKGDQKVEFPMREEFGLIS